jgi:hypothetical protein
LGNIAPMTKRDRIVPVRAAEATGILLLKAGLVSALLVVFAPLPPFRLGIWFQTEPMTIAFVAASGLTTLGLLLFSLSRPRAVQRILIHPFALLPLAMGLWSLAAAPSAGVPMLSVVGAPEMGEGAVWFLNLAVLVAGTRLLYRSRRDRRWVAFAALATAGVATLLTAYERYLTGATPGWAWSPFYFPDYLAFFGLFAVVVSETWLQPRRPLARAAGVLFGLAIVALSSNWSAMVLVAAAAVLVAGVERVVPLALGRKRLFFAGAALAVPAVVMAGVATIAYAGSRFAFPYTQWSRHVLNKMVLDVFSHQPEAMLFGFGWGHFVDVVMAHGTQRGVRLYGGSEWGPNWDALSLAYFHSHNALVEAALSAGVVALLLAWITPAAVPLFARAKHASLAGALAVALAGLETVWFQFPVSLPLLAMALAGLARPAGARIGGRTSRALARVALAGALLLQAYALRVTVAEAVQHQRAARYDAELTAIDPTRGRDCRTALKGETRGGIHLAWLYREYALRLARKIDDGEPLGRREADRLRFYICAVGGRLDGKASLRLWVADLLVRSELAFGLGHPALREVADEHLKDWEPRVQQVLERAPRRSDLAIPYLSWRFERQDEQAILRVTRRLLARDPRDAVGLWFSGAVLLGDPSRAGEGASRLRLSLQSGIERFMPVPPDLKAQILEAPRP